MNRHAKGSAGKLVAGGLVGVAACWAVLAFGQSTSRQYDFDIARLPMSQAVLAFTQQTGLQLAYVPGNDEEEETWAGEVRGRHTADEALSALLPPGFTFAWINSRTISVLSPSQDAPPGGVSTALAGLDPQHTELSWEQQRSVASGKAGSARDPYAFRWATLVEAPRLALDTLDLDVPVTIMDRQRIRALGVSTVTDLFRYLTQQNHLMGESYLVDGTQFVDLRGLGFDTTLVLINGHRTIATASSLSFNAFDLNSIPLGAVERIEIVSDSMSAVYGADAIGGVVNIVLRDHIPGPTLDVDYGAASGGAVERHAAFSASGSAGRAQGSLVLDYFDRGALPGSARDRWNNQDFRRYGGSDWRAPTASPGNVRSTTLDNLPGLPSSLAAIPASGDGQLTPADFLATAGRQDLESLFRFDSILSQARRAALVAGGEYEFASGASVYGDFLYVDRENASESTPSVLDGALVPATNPHNPFETDVLVDALLTEIGPQVFARRGGLMRAVGGVRGKVGAWEWEASLHRSRDDETTVRSNMVDPLRAASALAATDAEQALNPFAGGAGNSPELLASLLAMPLRNSFRTQMTQATAHLRGPLFMLPAGRVDVLLGAERRKEQVRYDVSAGPPLTGAHERSITAAFGEMRLPLADTAAGIPAVHELALVLSGRLDAYSDIGDSFNPEYALLWRPTAALTVRTSWSESFRPPPLFDLYMPALETSLPTIDPARNNELVVPEWRAGGNASLKPSRAESFAAGLQFAAPRPSGLRLEASYWRIRVADTIRIPAGEELLAAEHRFPERIVRGEATAADVAAGFPGRLELIDVTRLNCGSLTTSGLDLSAALRLDTRIGQFMPQLWATWVHDFTTTDPIDEVEVERVGVANVQGSVVRWRGVASLLWNRRGMSISGTVRYVPSYDDVDALGRRTGRSVDAQTLIDAQVAFDLSGFAGAQSLGRGLEIRAGAFNLLDVEPPFAEVTALTGYDGSQGDLRQRFWYLKLSKRF